MRLSDVAIVTITWARSDEEADLLDRSLEALAAHGAPVFVADRGTNVPFTGRLQGRQRLHVTTAPVPGLVAQVQESLAAAARLDTRFLLYTEPDKLPFFQAGLREFIATAPGDDDVGVVIAARSPASFETFPPMQRYTESVANELCARIIGTSGDFFYGPFLIHRSLVQHVAQISPQLGWGWRPSTFRAAHRHGRRLVMIPGEYRCPEDQRQEDDTERAHRLRQLSQNVLGLV